MKKPKFLPHVHLENLIKSKFGVVLEIEHAKHNQPAVCKATTMVAAFKNMEELKHSLPIAHTYAHCAHADRFERSKGLTLALRRLYRKLCEIEQKVIVQD